MASSSFSIVAILVLVSFTATCAAQHQGIFAYSDPLPSGGGYEVVELCDDSCDAFVGVIGDGKCDDSWPNANSNICAPGTDCRYTYIFFLYASI